MSRLSRRDALKAGSALALSPLLVNVASQFASAADPYADALMVDGPPPPMVKNSFTIAVLPDTQHYSEDYPENYFAQTRWIADHRQDRNIACVLHLGDVTNRNTQREWDNAVAAMNVLDDVVPYFMVPGNHDYSDHGSCVNRTTGFNDAFPLDKFKDLPTFGGVYDREPDRFENSYHTFSAGGRDFLVVGLEFGPRDDVIRWANDVVARHKDREAILITHAYMYYDDTRYDWKKFGAKQTWNPHKYGVAKTTSDDVNDGEELWRKLVRRHDNFIVTINGHVLKDGLGRLTSQSPNGREVQQMLVNFQMKPKGGDGWLRLLEFRPDGRTLQVYDYSPTRNQHNESEQNQFSLKLAPLAT